MAGTVFEIMEQLENTPGRLDKEEIMRGQVKNDLLKRLFVAACDPYVDYGVRKFKRPKPLEKRVASDEKQALALLDVLLPDLASRKLTGNEARDTVAAVFSTMDERQQKWAERVLLKNLRCGVSESIVEKTWPGLIKKFAVQLAETVESRFEDGKLVLEGIMFPVRVDPKLDGLRLIAIKQGRQCTLYTRNGTVIETLPRIKKAIEDLQEDYFVLDGEAMADNAGTEAWNRTAEVMMARKTMKDDSSMVFNVFDAMPLSDWIAQDCPFMYGERLDYLGEIIKDAPDSGPLRQVPSSFAEDCSDIQAYYEKCLDEGYEGVMIKAFDSLYKFKRSKGVLKLKPTVTHEGVIVGHYDGNLGSRNEGLFGGFEVLLPNGVITRVGGGFSNELRAEIQLSRDSYVGRIAECECQPPLTEDGKMRFPVFLRFRDPSDVDPKVLQAFHTWEIEQRRSK